MECPKCKAGKMFIGSDWDRRKPTQIYWCLSCGLEGTVAELGKKATD